MRNLTIVLAAPVLILSHQAQAQVSGPVFGVDAFVSERSCSGVGPTTDCILSHPNIYVVDETPGSTTASTNFSYNGSVGSGAGQFNGTLFPVLHAYSSSAPNDARVNGSAAGFTSLTYTGSTPSPFGMQGALTIDNSVQSPSDYLLPDGGLAQVYLAIYDETAFINDYGASTFGVAYGAECGQAPGLLGWGIASATAPGGAFTVTATTSSCGGGPLMLNPGESVVAYSNLSLFTNRGGLLDSSHTLTTTLDPALGQGVVDNLQTHLISAGDAALPEPSTWATMLLGFAAIGGAMRYGRRKGIVSSAVA